MATIVITPGGVNDNCYVSIVDATAILDERLYTTAWINATVDNQTRALIWASKVLDSRCEWHGRKANLDGSMDWPRQSVHDKENQTIDDETIPEFLKRATAEQALHLLEENRLTEQEAQIKSDSLIPGMKTEFFEKADYSDSVIPRDVQDILEPYVSSMKDLPSVNILVERY